MTGNDATHCALCGGRRVGGATTFSADLGFGVVVVRNVPALVCEECGEEWLADATVRRLEDITNRSRRTRHFVEVLAF